MKMDKHIVMEEAVWYEVEWEDNFRTELEYLSDTLLAKPLEENDAADLEYLSLTRDHKFHNFQPKMIDVRLTWEGYMSPGFDGFMNLVHTIEMNPLIENPEAAKEKVELDRLRSRQPFNGTFFPKRISYKLYIEIDPAPRVLNVPDDVETEFGVREALWRRIQAAPLVENQSAHAENLEIKKVIKKPKAFGGKKIVKKPMMRQEREVLIAY